jgi:hypothetical protein
VLLRGAGGCPVQSSKGFRRLLIGFQEASRSELGYVSISREWSVSS